jgi:hypothetical protein
MQNDVDEMVIVILALGSIVNGFRAAIVNTITALFLQCRVGGCLCALIPKSHLYRQGGRVKRLMWNEVLDYREDEADGCGCVG